MLNRYYFEEEGSVSQKGMNFISGGKMSSQNGVKAQESNSSLHIFNLKNSEICEVWEDNLETEINRISDLVDYYNVISIVIAFTYLRIQNFLVSLLLQLHQKMRKILSIDSSKKM